MNIQNKILNIHANDFIFQFSDVSVDGELLKSEAVLSLTSSKLKGEIDSFSSEEKISAFIIENKLSASPQPLIETLISEAGENKFVAGIRYSK